MKKWYDIKAAAPGRAEIYIYEEIGMWGVSAKQFATDLKALGSIKEIDLHVNSPGGSVFDGMAIYNLLKNHPADVYTYIDGLAASMGSVIALAGDVVSMPGNAYMMIHNPLAAAYGEEKDMQKMADILAKIKAGILSVYMEKTGKSQDEVSALMDAETWMTGAEAKELGFVDDVTDELAVAASFDLSKFENAPGILLGTPAAVAAITEKEGVMPIKDPATAPDKAVDESAIRARVLADEATRRADIKGVFGKFADAESELLASCLDDMACTADSASRKLLAKLGQDSQPTDKTPRISTARDEIQEHFLAHAENAIAVRAGLEKPANGNELRGYTLLELARMSLERRGLSTGGHDKMAIIASAFTHTSSDFPLLLANNARKAMMKGYDEAKETFQMWTSVGSLPDFKTSDRSDLGSFPTLGLVREGAEFKYATLAERREQIALATYGAIFAITRQAVINDDLNAFVKIPMKQGAAAKRTVGDLAYGILTANAAMADSVALFHSTHANLAGSGGAINSTTVDAGRAAMGVQTQGNAYLNIRPAFLLCPIAKEGLAKQTIQSEFELSGSKNLTVPNPVRSIVEVISDARLTSTAWYLVASPGINDTVEVAYLDGNPNPTLEQQSGWSIDGVEFKVRIDAGAKALDWRTMYKDPGA